MESVHAFSCVSSSMVSRHLEKLKKMPTCFHYMHTYAHTQTHCLEFQQAPKNMVPTGFSLSNDVVGFRNTAITNRRKDKKKCNTASPSSDVTLTYSGNRALLFCSTRSWPVKPLSTFARKVLDADKMRQGIWFSPKFWRRMKPIIRQEQTTQRTRKLFVPRQKVTRCLSWLLL